MTTPQTLFSKIWEKHVVTQAVGSPAVIYIDLHLVHEVTSPQAFTVCGDADSKSAGRIEPWQQSIMASPPEQVMGLRVGGWILPMN